jgi:outer membrane protein OmpU
MGVTNNGTLSTFSSRVRATISMSGQTDNGLSFGGSFLVNEAEGAAGGTLGNVFVSGAFGRLAMGEINNAHQLATGQVGGVGYLGTATYSDVTYMPKVGTALHYSYSIDGLTLHVTSQQLQASGTSNTTAIGVAYKIGDITVAAGTAERGTARQNSFSVRGSFDGLSAALVYLDNNTAQNTTVASQTAFSLGYKMDALTVTAFSRQTNNRGTVRNTNTNGFGVGYSLGGGATLAAGYSTSSVATEKNLWNAGLTFSF